MTDERDPKVSRRYRDLPGEEPPRELDQTILAAAHRSVDKPHAPLVVPAGRHRWYYSIAAAAVLVLAIAVTVHVDQRQDEELAEQGRQAYAPDAARSDADNAPAELRKERAAGEMAASRAAPSPMAARAPVSPAQELERIVQLRRQGRDDEADKALAEFRKRYPQYVIPQAMLEKVERKAAR